MERQWGHKGSPWEFNLRDMFRWCQLMQADQTPGFFNPGQHVALVYGDRMRAEADKAQVHFFINLSGSLKVFIVFGFFFMVLLLHLYTSVYVDEMVTEKLTSKNHVILSPTVCYLTCYLQCVHLY